MTNITMTNCKAGGNITVNGESVKGNKMTLPSKELVSAVFGCNISSSIDEQGITRIISITEESDGAFLNFGYQGLESSQQRYTNIYEFAHMVKEWAYKEHDIRVASSKNGFSRWIAELLILSDDVAFYEDTEPEAVIKAGEWILKEIEK